MGNPTTVISVPETTLKVLLRLPKSRLQKWTSCPDLDQELPLQGRKGKRPAGTDAAASEQLSKRRQVDTTTASADLIPPLSAPRSSKRHQVSTVSASIDQIPPPSAPPSLPTPSAPLQHSNGLPLQAAPASGEAVAGDSDTDTGTVTRRHWPADFFVHEVSSGLEQMDNLMRTGRPAATGSARPTMGMSKDEAFGHVFGVDRKRTTWKTNVDAWKAAPERLRQCYIPYGSRKNGKWPAFIVAYRHFKKSGTLDSSSDSESDSSGTESDCSSQSGSSSDESYGYLDAPRAASSTAPSSSYPSSPHPHPSPAPAPPSSSPGAVSGVDSNVRRQALPAPWPLEHLPPSELIVPSRSEAPTAPPACHSGFRLASGSGSGGGPDSFPRCEYCDAVFDFEPSPTLLDMAHHLCSRTVLSPTRRNPLHRQADDFTMYAHYCHWHIFESTHLRLARQEGWPFNIDFTALWRCIVDL